jgi:hypothetical protein
MAKESKTKVPGGGFPRRYGPVAKPDQARGDRLTLRMHPDIMEILAMRAAERGVSRSHLVEQILVGFMRADPRNPKLDPVGRIAEGAEPPLALRERSPVQLADRWRKFVTAHEIVIGAPPPADWLDDPSGYWDAPAHADRGPADDEDRPQASPGRWARRRRSHDG